MLKRNNSNVINPSTSIKKNTIEKQYTILVGKLMGQEYVPDIQPSTCFEEGV